MSLDLDWIRPLEDDQDEDRRIYGVVVGKVINIMDPQGLGRVQVQLPFLDSLDLNPWARIASPMAGMQHGHFFVPKPQDEVLIAFEQGDIRVPYVIGCLWNSVVRPPQMAPGESITKRVLRTQAGNQIVFEELPPRVTIQAAAASPTPLPMPASPTGPHATVQIAPTEITVEGVKVQLTSAGSVQIMVGSNIINVTAKGISITGTPNLDLTAAGKLNLSAPTINIKGAMVNIN